MNLLVISSSSRAMALRFLVLVSVLSTAMAACSSSSCYHGTCMNDSCQCQGNYTGPDCSIPTSPCPDGERTCFNGSECVENNEKDPITKAYKYHCDCSKAFGVSSFAGIQCEYASTSVCESGKLSSIYAFCTNGGECVKTVVKGEEHQGCKCAAEFEGAHCQYLVGTAPAADLAATYSAGDPGLTGVATFFTVVICLGLAGLVIVVFFRKRLKDERAKEGFPVDETEAAEFEEVQAPAKLPDVI
jgi:hypothetical protein